MLILTRSVGTAFFIDLADSVDPQMPVGDLSADGPIEVSILSIKGNQARVGTEAPDELLILREEIFDEPFR